MFITVEVDSIDTVANGLVIKPQERFLYAYREALRAFVLNMANPEIPLGYVLSSLCRVQGCINFLFDAGIISEEVYDLQYDYYVSLWMNLDSRKAS